MDPVRSLLAQIARKLRRPHTEWMPPGQALALAKRECVRLGLEWQEPSEVFRRRREYLVASPCYPLSRAGFVFYRSLRFHVDPFTGDVRFEEHWVR